MTIFEDHPHRRFNPLTGEWVLVSPHRTKRPWQGQLESHFEPAANSFDPECYLCPGNVRANGDVNPAYQSTLVFDNDFAALYSDVPRDVRNDGDLLVAETERGICRVICYSPDHSLTLSRLPASVIREVIEAWVLQSEELGSIDWIRSVQIFENRGAMMGASNPHPHGQIWATESVPTEVETENLRQLLYYQKHGRTLLGDYWRREVELGERVVCENRGFLAVIPFWAVWPFEVLVISKRTVGAMVDLTVSERDDLAEILKRVTTRYDNLFEISFPYSMGFHQRPTEGLPHPYVHFHAHFFPPLLRSATVRKFLVGFEMLAMPQRDITPEAASMMLGKVDEKHFMD